VFQTTTDTLVTNDFQAFPQDLRKGDRLYAHAPPVIPHGVFMREDCAACHDGVAARPEIRCTHPERLNCVQCHVARAASY
jgi:cytochrome c-type protein NapB